MKLPRAVEGAIPKLMVANPNELQNLRMVHAAERQLVSNAGTAALNFKNAKDQMKLSAAMGRSLNEYNKMLAYVENTPAFDIANDEYVPKDLRDEILQSLEVDLKDVVNDEGKAFIPAFEVRGAIHDYHAKKIQQAGREFIGSNKTLLGRFDSSLNKRTGVGATSIVERNVKEEVEQMSATGDMLYNQAVESGDLFQAIDTIESMAESGLWQPSKVAEHINKVAGDVQYSEAVQIFVGGDAGEINTVLNSLGDESVVMTNAQKMDIYAKGNSTLDRKEKEREENIKLVSEGRLNDSLVELGRRKVLPWGEVEKVKGDLDPGHYRTLVNANRAAMNQGGTSQDNPLINSRLAARVATLNIADQDIPFANRKEAVMNEIYAAMGYNPINGEYTGPAQIKNSTAFTLLDQVNKTDSRVLDSPRLKMRIEQTYRMLTGAGRDAVDVALGATKHKVAAAEYEAEISKAALEYGPGFDPEVWHNENWLRFELPALSDAYGEFKESQLEIFAVTRQITVNNRTHTLMDLSASIKKVEAALEAGTVTEDYAIEVINRLDLQGKKEQAKWGDDYGQ